MVPLTGCISTFPYCLCSFGFTLSASVTGKWHLSIIYFCKHFREVMGSAEHKQSSKGLVNPVAVASQTEHKRNPYLSNLSCPES